VTETGSLDPPPEFADLIRRQARLITRLNTKRDDWLEFTAIAAFKIGLKVLATLVVVPIILCIFEGLAWIQVAGRGKVYSAIRPVTDNLLFLGILLFAIGFLSYLLESGALIREGPRKTAWSETLVSEYISWFPSHQEIMTDLGGDREIQGCVHWEYGPSLRDGTARRPEHRASGFLTPDDGRSRTSSLGR
jgi:hypothetical protein